MNEISIIGTGGFAREVLCIIDDLDLYSSCNGFYEPDDVWEANWKDRSIMGLPVHPYSSLSRSSMLTIGIGNSQVRERVSDQLKDNDFATLIHPKASISRWATIGVGSVVCAGTIVTSQIKIGRHSQFNLNTTIGHDCELQDFLTTAPSVNISGICNIGKHVYFGTGAATKQGITICGNVIIGMGAMVVKDIDESGTYVGIPAKKLCVRLKK